MKQDFNMPSGRLESPEVHGKRWSGGLSAGASSSQKVILSEVYDSFVFDLPGSIDDEKSLEKNGLGLLNGQLAIWEQIDVIMRLQGDAPAMWGLKWQFLGNGRSSGQMGWKASLAALTGGMTEEEKVETYNEQRKYDGKLEVNAGEVNLLVGHRTSASMMFYTNSFYSWYDIDSKLTSNQFPTEQTKAWSWQLGQIIGVEFGNEVSLRLETGMVHGSYQGRLTRNDAIGAASFGFHWK